jgi:hypothetical protein
MAYNKYRWYTKGRPRRPLPANAPLLLKILHGDFDYSYMFLEAEYTRQEASASYDEAYKNYRGTEEWNRRRAAEDAARMKRIKALKLMEKAHEEELKIIDHLKAEMALEFGVCLWDRAMESDFSSGSIEDLYWWYKREAGLGQTPSEIAIQLGRKNTRGLR